jgi:tetratricopeptide (TPR) repeat protein
MGNPEPTMAQAISAHRRGDLKLARVLYNRVLEQNPHSALALHLLGKIDLDEGAPSVALTRFAQAARSVTPSLELRYDTVRALRGAGRLQEALAALNDLTSRYSSERALFIQQAEIFATLDRVPDALAAYRRAIELEPRNPEFRRARAALLRRVGNIAAAIADLEIAAGIHPDDPDLQIGLAGAQTDARNWIKALHHLDRSLAIRPDHVPALLGRAPLLFALGRLSEGWAAYAHRHRSLGPEGRPFPSPRWNGEPLTGKTLLLTFEQGLGEQILFASMIPDLLAAGATVVAEVHQRLLPLFTRAFPAVTFVPWQKPVHPATTHPAIDFHCPLGDAGLWLRPTFEAFSGIAPYLRSDASRTAALRRALQQEAPGRRLVGIAWASHAPHSGAAKSIPLAALSPLFQIPAVRWVSLQHGATPGLLDLPLTHRPAVLPSRTTEDFDELASAVDAMDDVVSISTAVAHLAGSLGKRTWVLLPRQPKFQYWYWFAGRSPNPWYPTVTTVPQPTAGDWGGAVSRVALQVADMPVGSAE